MKDLREQIIRENRFHTELMSKLPNQYYESEEKRHLKALIQISERFGYEVSRAYEHNLGKCMTYEDAQYVKYIDKISSKYSMYDSILEHSALKHNFKQQGLKEQELERIR